MYFVGTVSADTPYYPTNGKGGYTATATASHVRDALATVITGMYGGREGGAQPLIRLFDQDNNEVFSFKADDTSRGIWEFPFGQDGPTLTGNWYVKTDQTTPDWRILYQVKESL
jgi:hypothetical protein